MPGFVKQGEKGETLRVSLPSPKADYLFLQLMNRQSMIGIGITRKEAYDLGLLLMSFASLTPEAFNAAE